MNAGLPGAPTVPKLPNYEIQALKDLFYATDGPNWEWMDFTVSGVHWNFSGNPNPCNPLWQSILCAPMNGELHIIALDLQLHELYGTIPPSFFNLTQLRGMSMATNYLHGTIPSTISQLQDTEVVDFANNALTGTIPSELGLLSKCRAIYFYNNNLNGTLPMALGDMNELRVMKFTLNQLTGTLPEEFSKLIHLRLLYLGANQFHGTIPASYGNLQNITTLYLYNNQLTGGLPSTLTNLTQINTLRVDQNHLSGPLPDYIGNFTSLLILELDQNSFTGTIPYSIVKLGNKLQNLYIELNMLTGTIPNEICSMYSLTTLDFGVNRLTGTIPDCFSNIPYLGALSLDRNELTGTIPIQLGDISRLETLQLAVNKLTGTLPHTFDKLVNLTGIYFFDNHLTGRIPEKFGDMTAMVYFYGDSNHLTGSLPKSLSNMTKLVSLFLDDNLLSGSLEGVFDGTKQPFLNLIELSDNQLTGQLPDSLFQLPQLRTLVLVSNCFSGVIPHSICDCSTLATISMDGLRSANSCRQVILPGVSSSYILTSKVSGGVPACLFSMPILNTLHLSGNGLTGNLPHVHNISENLIDFAVSHNKITGSIPPAFQKRQWYNLDLSYNKLGGTMHDDFWTIKRNFTISHIFSGVSSNFTLEVVLPSATLSLRNNRLSSDVPPAVFPLVNISVLEGNLFDCRLDESDLPPHDSAHYNYECGSTAFDIAYYLWLACIAAVSIVIFAIYYWRHHLEPYVGGVFTAIVYIKRWLRVVAWYDQVHFRSKARLHHFQYVVNVSEAVCSFAFWTTVFILLITLPMYSGISHYYGTHTYEYAWTVSAAFMSGYPALSALLLGFAVLVIFLLIQFRYSFRALRSFLHELPSGFSFSVMEDFEEETAIEKSEESKYSSTYEKFGIYLAFFLINVVVVIGVNIAYVYVAIYQSRSVFTFAQIALSIFKLMWNNLGSVYLIRWTHHQLASSATKEWKSKGAGFFAIQLFVALFNYIAIPCLVVAVISPNCFNNVVVNAPTVTSRYYYESCSFFTVRLGCVAYSREIGSTSYSPPFTYSYECSSSLITYYAPSFVYLALIVTFVNPLLEVLMQQAHLRRTKGTWMAAQLDYWVPLILQDLLAEEDQEKPYDIFNPYFDANLLLVTAITYFGVLLTFGLVFPPLAVCMLVSIYAVVYTGKLEVGRFLTNAIEQNLHRYIDIIENECHGVGSIPKLRQCVAMLLVFACWFYTPFLFDTLGDSIGVDNASWVLVILPLFPPVIYMGHMMYIYGVNRYRTQNDLERRSASIELRKSDFLRSQRPSTTLQLDNEMTTITTAESINETNRNSEEEEENSEYTWNILRASSQRANKSETNVNIE